MSNDTDDTQTLLSIQFLTHEIEQSEIATRYPLGSVFEIIGASKVLGKWTANGREMKVAITLRRVGDEGDDGE